MNSNYMPHMLYKNTNYYELEPTLNRMYIIYVDKNKQGHIIWNPNTMTINDYIKKFDCISMECYEDKFINEFNNESNNEKSYIKYINKRNEKKVIGDDFSVTFNRVERTIPLSSSSEKINIEKTKEISNELYKYTNVEKYRENTTNYLSDSNLFIKERIIKKINDLDKDKEYILKYLFSFLSKDYT